MAVVRLDESSGSEQKPEKFELATSALAVVSRATTGACRRIQSFLAAPFGWLSRPLFLLIRNPKYHEDESGTPKAFRYRADMEKPVQAVGFRVLMWLQRLAGRLGGVRSGPELYRRLLAWDPRLPISGFRDSETVRTIEWIGRADHDPENPGRGWNVFWLNR